MSRIETFSSNTLLDDGVKLTCEWSVPILGSELETTPNSKIDGFTSIMTNQYVRAIKEILKHYELSPLPQSFIKGQEILVTSLPTLDGLYGMFNIMGNDDMIVDANTICDIGGTFAPPAPFLFGHEMGHKIARYRATIESYKHIADILGISFESNEILLHETYADECGNMVSTRIHEHGILPVPLSENKREGIKQLILKDIYR